MTYSGVLNLHVDRELNACVGVFNTDFNLLVDRELNACVGVFDTRNHGKHDLFWSS